MKLNCKRDLYEHGKLIRSESKNVTRETKIQRVRELVSDSVYKVLDYHDNGVIKSSGFEIVDIGLRTNHWVYYDSLGRKLREGHYLPMRVFDTIFYPDNDPLKRRMAHYNAEMVQSTVSGYCMTALGRKPE
jgi:hypothetical protein